MAKVLTDAAVRKLRPTDKRRVVRDGGGQSLYLVIQPSGHKSWMMRFRRPGGKAAKIVLGPVCLSGSEAAGEPAIGTPLTLSAARQAAAQVHRDRARGVDVAADRKARRRGTAETFGAAAREFVEEHVEKTRQARETKRVLAGVAARWADRPIEAITADDVHAVVDEATRRGIPGLARRTEGASDARGRKLARALSKMFAWLRQHRRIAVNPCSGLYVPPPPPARDRVLTEDEVARFWRASSAMDRPFGCVFKLLLLTGARLNEIAGLTWDELTEDEIRLPGARTKNHRSFVIPLAEPAREIVASLPRIDGCPFVFSTNGRTSVSGWSRAKKRLDGLMGSPSPWRLHDLRRTAATMMAEIGVQPHIVEACLNHVSGARAGVAGIYNRAAYATEKRAALELWARHIARIAGGGQ